MEQAQDLCKKQLEQLEISLKSNNFIHMIAEKTNQKHTHVFFAGIALLSLVILSFSGQAALCNVLGFLYPMYASYKAIKTPRNSRDDTEWLTYWIVFGGLNMVESLTSVLTSFIPFYFLAKTVFLVWLYLPQTRGCDILFRTFIEPSVAPYEKTIDAHISKVTDTAASIAEKLDSSSTNKKEK